MPQGIYLFQDSSSHGVGKSNWSTVNDNCVVGVSRAGGAEGAHIFEKGVNYSHNLL